MRFSGSLALVIAPVVALWPVQAVMSRSLDPVAEGARGGKDKAIVGAPLAGGWSAIANPDSDRDVRAAATAALQQIPLGKAKLRRIEKAEHQVVAGTNIRLTLRLSTGRRWEATVWHKLDGSFEVTSLSRLK